MSRKSKAYQAAGDHMAHSYGYDVTLEAGNLEKWVLAQIEAYRDVWDIIWKAARRAEWEHSQDDLGTAQARLEQTEGSLEQAIQTSKNRGDRIAQLGAVNGNLLAENVRLKKALAEAKLPSNSDRLYDQVERELHHVENALELAEEELVRLREQLAREKTNHHQTRTTLQAAIDKRNELLRRALAAESALASRPRRAEPRIPKKPEGDGWELSWVRMTGETITGTVTTNVSATENVTTHPLVRCQAVLSGTHACKYKTEPGREHPWSHLCHCGVTWS